MSYIYLTMICLTIPPLLMMISNLITKWEESDSDKFSPFECGFDPMMKTNSKLTIRFYLMAIIFLIFDAEIALILPMVVNKNFSNLILWLITIIMFIMILIIGIFYEWWEGTFDWSN
uniref:NADH dehydrogenase subunit 3 n=1 Tax=Aeolothrips xinjiangensis TaxID=2942826 RepID=UPI002028DDEA|nr:NADH dehydrogenase subunit 3 [Aeolothrips xinjiangensis]UQJ77470.1 NADH dehydrogenase subunit 3 [Aeolothrips xinjiangensis]